MADDTLTSSALSAFFSAVNDNSKNDQQSVDTHQAEVVKFDQNGLAWCKIKDSDVVLTPVENMTTMTKVGDIIDVTIENGVATGKPSVMSPTVTMDYANAMMMALAGDTSLLEQYSSHGMFQDITAQKASFGSLEAQNADIENAYIENAKINKAIIDSLEATAGNFKQLQANDMAVKRFSAQQITATKAFITSLIANNAIIESLQARNATIMDLLVEQANIDKLVSGEATVQSLVAGSIDAQYVRADRANIDEAWVKELMGMSAWFTSDVTVTGDQSVTGQLKSVLIDGDTARFRNIYADALKILGQDGLYHRLNLIDYDDKTYEYEGVEISQERDENPSDLGWYELVDGNYVLSEDDEIGVNTIQHIQEIESGDTIIIEDELPSNHPITVEWHGIENDEPYESSHVFYFGSQETYGIASYDGDETFIFTLDNSKSEVFDSLSYQIDKIYYIRVGLADAAAQGLIEKYGDSLDNALHGSHIIAETITATQLDASSVRTALLEAAEIQIGSYATPHIRMYEGNLGFYPGSTMSFTEIPKYEPVDQSTLSGEENPSIENWYEAIEISTDGIDQYPRTSNPVTSYRTTRYIKNNETITVSGSTYFGSSGGSSSSGGMSIGLSYFIPFSVEFTGGVSETKSIVDDPNVSDQYTLTYDGDRTFIVSNSNSTIEEIEYTIDNSKYIATDDLYIVSLDTEIDSSKTYYKLTSEYLHGSPRSRRWYERDDEVGYFRTVDYEPNPDKIYYDGVEASVAYVTNQELYIPRAVVTDKMAVGTPENGEWVWEVSDSQNLSLTWGGRYGGVS